LVAYLIDTNVISEVRKGPRCDPRVAAWWRAVRDADVFLSVLVLGEIRRGVERARGNDPAKAEALEAWLAAVTGTYGERILAIDQAAADEWGRMNARRPVSTVDALLAATAKAHGLTLVTRNVSDVADLGADLVNPFEGLV